MSLAHSVVCNPGGLIIQVPSTIYDLTSGLTYSYITDMHMLICSYIRMSFNRNFIFKSMYVATYVGIDVWCKKYGKRNKSLPLRLK